MAGPGDAYRLAPNHWPADEPTEAPGALWPACTCGWVHWRTFGPAEYPGWLEAWADHLADVAHKITA